MSKHKIDIEKSYNLPEKISVIYFDKYILVISPLTANWIVLQSAQQLEIFNSFRSGNSIRLTLDNPLYTNEDVKYVVTQIEARRLCDKKTHNSTDDVRSLHLYLTNKCNLCCPHCYMYSGKEEQDELSTEEILNLLAEYRNIAHGTRITLSGGEPSIRTDLNVIVKKASMLGLEVKLLTNGAMLTEQRIAAIAPFINSVQISIDGFSENSNSRIRGIGHFEAALNAVDCFMKHGIETSIAITPPLELLEKHTSEYAIFAKKMIEKYEGQNFEIKFAEGLSRGRNINPTEKQNEEYASIIRDIQRDVYGDEIDLYTFVEKIRKNVIFDNCMFGVFSVSSVGDVYFCPEIGSLQPVANIRTTSFSEILKESSIAENATEVSKLEPCKNCDLLYICGGGCRVKEFPLLVKRKTFSNIDYSTIPPKTCSDVVKEKFYRMMIESNEYLFEPLSEE